LFWAVSQSPLDKLDAYKARMGWTFPWASSFGSDFNYDFAVGITEEQQSEEGYEYNFAAQPPSNPPSNPWSESAGADPRAFMRELPGMSSFVLEDGEVYHAYSAYARGLDGLWGMYQWLDRAPLGRNEEGAGLWGERRGEYGAVLERSAWCVASGAEGVDEASAEPAAEREDERAADAESD